MLKVRGFRDGGRGIGARRGRRRAPATPPPPVPPLPRHRLTRHARKRVFGVTRLQHTVDVGGAAGRGGNGGGSAVSGHRPPSGPPVRPTAGADGKAELGTGLRGARRRTVSEARRPGRPGHALAHVLARVRAQRRFGPAQRLHNALAPARHPPPPCCSQRRRRVRHAHAARRAGRLACYDGDPPRRGQAIKARGSGVQNGDGGRGRGRERGARVARPRGRARLPLFSPPCPTPAHRPRPTFFHSAAKLCAPGGGTCLPPNTSRLERRTPPPPYAAWRRSWGLLWREAPPWRAPWGRRGGASFRATVCSTESWSKPSGEGLFSSSFSLSLPPPATEFSTEWERAAHCPASPARPRRPHARRPRQINK